MNYYFISNVIFDPKYMFLRLIIHIAVIGKCIIQALSPSKPFVSCYSNFILRPRRLDTQVILT